MKEPTFIVVKTMTGASGRKIRKVLCGPFGEFVVSGYATNIKRWKTVWGPQKWMDERPGFLEAHQKDGSHVRIEQE